MAEHGETPPELKQDIKPESESEETFSDKNDEQPKTVPAKTYSYLREQYTPHRDASEQDLIDSGLEPDSPEFRKARKRVARRYLELEKKGEVDNLTGILNRPGFERRFKFEASRALRSGEPISLLYLDLNKFKEINDRYGHAEGDQMLKRVAKKLSSESRGGDTQARIGGDEFAVILPETTSDNALEYWERINSRVFHTDPDDEQEVHVVAGVSQVDPRELDESMKLADAAMYKAKELSRKTGKNEVVRAEDLSYEDIMEAAEKNG